MTAFLTAIVLKGSILMIAAAVLVALMYRASAATRHFVWTLVVAGLLVMPVLSAALPEWTVVVPSPSVETRAAIIPVRALSSAGAIPVTTTEPGGDTLSDDTSLSALGDVVPWAVLPAAIYLLGVLALLGRLAIQRSSARRIVNEAGLVNDREWIALLNDCALRIGVWRPVALRRSRVQVMPMTTGTIAPSIVIPADADTWDEDRRRAVLLHELAHIARQDCLTQLIAAVASALYWCHPGVWYVARRLRIEREVACDDRVLAAGAQPREYAGHLLDLAYTWSGRRAPALAVGMTTSRKLEGRMRAVLDPARNRATPTRRAWLVGAAVAGVLLLPLAAMTMTSASADSRSELMASSSEHETPNDVQIVRTQSQDSAAASQDTVTGTWEVRRSSRPGRVRLTVKGGGLSMDGDFDESDLGPLTSQPVPDNGPIRFSIRREPGVFEIEGTLRAGNGSGTFTFVPNQAFIAGLASRGFSRPSTLQLFTLAQHDVGLEFVDVLAAEKYARPELADLVRAAQHGVDAGFVKEMAATGYRVGTLDALIRFRDHGVDPDFVRGLRAQGVTDLSPEDLVRFRDHGVDPDYLTGMRQAGYGGSALDLVRARDHGVDAEYIGALREAGYSPLPLEDAIRARDHGIDPDYLRDMRQIGYKLPLADLIRARDHGVTPDYIVAMSVQGYKGLPIETLIRLRDHGVTPEYVLQVQKLRNQKPDVEELIRMRDRGVASSNYHLDRLLAYFSETKLARILEKALWKSEKVANKLTQKASR